MDCRASGRPAAMRYGLALVSVAVAAGLAQLYLRFHLPFAFNSFSAIRDIDHTRHS